MKEWLTLKEIADTALPEMPTSESGMTRYAERAGWIGHEYLARERDGRGGGTEYHYHLLPVLAQLAYAQRHMIVSLPAVLAPTALAPDHSISARASKERDARLAIVAAFRRFGRGLSLNHATRVQVFSDKFNSGSLEVDGWVRAIVPSLSKRSLIRWASAQRDGKIDALAHDPGEARRGTGVLDTANGGKVKAYMLALIAHQPHLSGDAVRTQCRHEFGDMISVVSKGVETYVPMPPVRTFQHCLKALKADNRVALIKLTNPDLYRSKLAITGVGSLRHVSEPNHLWQIDASPVDALCTDGRHAIYACIDIATRRVVFHVSRTPRASAVALLVRKAILAWGVPQAIKTDNGSDFVATDTKRLFASLDIEMILSDAYSPEQKGHVERVIKTFQHQVGPLLPGYVGHSVADRSAIEGRKSFAKRRGETDAETFGVSLTGPELQFTVDEWTSLVYQHRPHAGLKNRTPAASAALSSAPMRMVNERALDLLLMPVAGKDGQRVIGKQGIMIDGRPYMAPGIMVGTPVFVRMDPNDLGRAYAFAQDGAEFLGEAVCPELSGIHPQTVVRAAKEINRELMDRATRQVKADMRRISKGPSLIERAFDVARRDAPNVIPLPKREEVHSTAQIAAAIEAMGETVNPSRPLSPAEAAAHRRLITQMEADDERELSERFEDKYERRLAEIEAGRTAHLPQDEKIVALPETPKDRYRRYLAISRAAEAGVEMPGATGFDAIWAGRYEGSAECRAQAAMHRDFGEAYLT